jgi:hypothetical protein
LHDELASLQGCGERNKARQVRLACELDQIDRQLAAFRRLAQEAPTLRDVVMIAEPRDELHRLASDGTDADARAEMIRSGMAWALTKYLAGPPIKAIDRDVDGAAQAAA